MIWSPDVIEIEGLDSGHGIAAMQRIGRGVWRTRPPVSITEWCQNNFRLSPFYEATPGKYDLKANPFWVEPLSFMMEPDVRQVSMKKSTQVGGTLTLLAAMLALSDIDPAPAMVVTPDEISCIELRDRLYANAEEGESTRHKVPPERLRNTRHIDLQACRTYMAWAGSAQRLRGRACKRVFRSEIDVWPGKAVKGGDPIAASSERVKRFFDSLIYDESSPSGDNSVIAGLYDAGDQRQWWCQCPKCGRWQFLRFFPYREGELAGRGGVAGYKDADGNTLPVDQAIRKSHYVCVGGCKINQSQKDPMVRTGLWLPSGVKIAPDDTAKKPKLRGTPDRSRRHATYHLWSMHSPTVSISSLVSAYLDRISSNNLRKFFEDWCGLEYVTRRTIARWEDLAARLQATYTRGTVPQQCWFLTAGVDVQDHGCYWVVRGWGDQSTSWLIDFGYQRRFFGSEDAPETEVEGVLRSDLKQLFEALIDRRFPIFDPDGEGLVNPLQQKNMRVKLCGIDSNFHPRDVHQFVLSCDTDRVRCIRGDHTLSPKQRFRESLVERPARGGEDYADGGMKQWGIYTTAYKEVLRDTKWSIPAGRPSAWLLPNGIHRYGRDYMQQLVNERPVDEIGKDGRKKTSWIPRSSAIGVDYWDCEIYAFAMAEILLHEQDLTWDAEGWPVPKPQRQPTQHEQIVARDYQ